MVATNVLQLLREKDIRRQKEIVGELKCSFYRIRGKDINKKERV